MKSVISQYDDNALKVKRQACPKLLSSRATARVRPYNIRADQAKGIFIYCTGASLRSPWLIALYLLLHANVATSYHAEPLEYSDDRDKVRIFHICAYLYKSSSRLDNLCKSDYTKVTAVTETFMPLSELKLKASLFATNEDEVTHALCVSYPYNKCKTTEIFFNAAKERMQQCLISVHLL